MSTKRKYAVYVEYLGGTLDVTGLANVARANGMQVISATKFPMCVDVGAAVYGTPEQMSATRTAWEAAGHPSTNRRPRRAFPVNIKVPRQQWADPKPVAPSANPTTDRSA